MVLGRSVGAHLENVSKHWDDFDTELASAVFKVSKGPAKRELILYQESQARACRPTAGRAILRLFLQGPVTSGRPWRAPEP